MTVQCLEAAAAAAAPYLQASAALFAAELWSFLASGLSIQAHDRLVFGASKSADRRCSGAPMDAAGTESLSALP